MFKHASILGDIRNEHRCATTDDIRDVFGDYHHLLRWLTGFLVGDEQLTESCIVDACTIAETQAPEFHEWLVHWGARATVRCALQSQHEELARLAAKYETDDAPHSNHLPISLEHLLCLVRNMGNVRRRLDVFSRFVLVLRGIAKDSYDEVASQLGSSSKAVEAGYCAAFHALELAYDAVPPCRDYSVDDNEVVTLNRRGIACADS